MFNEVVQFTFNSIQKVVCVWQRLFELINTAFFSHSFVYVYLKQKAHHNIETAKGIAPGVQYDALFTCLLHVIIESFPFSIT